MRAALHIALFLSLMIAALAQDKPVNYSADSLIGTMSEQGPVRELFNNVKITYGDVYLTGDYCLELVDQKVAKMRGNVTMTQNDLRMYAPAIEYNGISKLSKATGDVHIIDGKTLLNAKRGVYDGKLNIAHFHDSVDVEDDSVIVFGDYIQYNKRTGNSFAYGNVLIKGKFTNALLKADTVEYYPDQFYFVSRGNPVLNQVDTASADSIPVFDTLSIQSSRMESYRYPDNEYYVFDDSVRINRGTMAAKCDSAVYYRTKGTFELYGVPVVWYENSQLYGDTINIILDGNKLKNILSNGNAFSGTNEDTTQAEMINQLAGAKIRMNFAGGEIDTIQSEGNSKSTYFSISEDSLVDAHQHDASKINIIFEEKEIDRIVFIDRINAVAVPENIYQRNFREFYLPNFRWRNDRPEKNIIDAARERTIFIPPKKKRG